MSSQNKVQFFDFVNQETYQFFIWVTEFSGLDLTALLKKAFDLVEKDPLFEMDLDVSNVARHTLGKLLEEQFWELFGVGDLEDFESMGLGLCCPEVEHLRSKLHVLIRPLLALTLKQICFEVAAEAILIREGKWNPDRERPEAT